jgi:hypothetical protein
VSWDDYRAAVVEVETPTGVIVVGPRHILGTRGAEFPALGVEKIHVITADNPNGEILSVDANIAGREALQAEVGRRGLTFWPARGGDIAWEHVEESFAVLGLSDEEALVLGRRFGQDAIFAWSSDRWLLASCDGQRVESTDWGSAVCAASGSRLIVARSGRPEDANHELDVRRGTDD